MKNLPLGFGTFLIDSWRCYKKCIPQWLIIGEKLFYRIIDDHRWPPPSFSRIRRFRFTLSQARKNWEKRVSEIAYFENPFFPFCTHSTMSYCIKQNCRRLENQRVGGVCAKRTKKVLDHTRAGKKMSTGRFWMSTTNELGRKSRMNRRNAKDDSKEIVK